MSHLAGNDILQKSLLLIFFRKVNLIELIIVGHSAKWHHKFWCSLKYNVILILLSWHLSHNKLSLKVMVESSLEHFFALSVSVSEEGHDVLLVFNEEVDHASLEVLALWLENQVIIIGLNSNIAVCDDALPNQLLQLVLDIHIIIEKIWGCLPFVNGGTLICRNVVT